MLLAHAPCVGPLDRGPHHRRGRGRQVWNRLTATISPLRATLQVGLSRAPPEWGCRSSVPALSVPESPDFEVGASVPPDFILSAVCSR